MIIVLFVSLLIVIIASVSVCGYYKKKVLRKNSANAPVNILYKKLKKIRKNMHACAVIIIIRCEVRVRKA